MTGAAAPGGLGMTMARSTLVRSTLVRSTLVRPAWDVPVRLVRTPPGRHGEDRTSVLVDPGLALPGVHMLEATTVTVAGHVLLERLAPASREPASGGPAATTLRDLVGALRHGAPGGPGEDADDSVCIAVDGTPFTVAVLEALARVPAGTRCTYTELAAAAGRPRAVRATASVMARNRVPLLLPCHRVVPASGGTGRYGWGEDVKVALLAAEEGCA